MKYSLKWSALAKIKHVNAVRYSYVWLFIVPLAAKALSKIEDAARITIFDYTFELQLQLPFSWKIFYFSALSFSLANLLFLWRCYSLLKDHRSLSDFQDEGKNELHLLRYAKEANLSAEDIGLDTFEYDYDKENKIHLAFWNLFGGLNSRRENSRVACTSLYVFGFVLVSIVLLQNLYAVLKAMT